MQQGNNNISEEKVLLLKKQLLFENVSAEELKLTFSDVKEIHVLEGELVFRKGERYHKGIYFAVNGKISLIRPDTGAKLLCENEAIGLSTFLAKTIYTLNAIAESDCDLIFVHEISIYKLMEISDDFRRHLVEYIINRTKMLTDVSTVFITDSSLKTVGSCMSSPIVSLPTGKTVAEAAEIMNEKRVRSLVIINRKQNIKGIITADHIISRYVSNINENYSYPQIERYMDPKPLIFPPEFPITEALDAMKIAGTTHAIITNRGKPAGVISVNTMEKALAENVGLYYPNIQDIKSIRELKCAFDNIYITANRLASSTRISRETLSAVSAIHFAIQKRVFILSSEEYEMKTGFSPSKIHYCILILGSGARKEMDLKPQINFAAVLGNDSDAETAEKFNKFLSFFAEKLTEAGYNAPICDARIAGNNFVMRLDDWKKEINSWTSKTFSETISCFSCTMDMAAFDGDITLEWDLKNYMLKKVAEKPVSLARLMSIAPPIKVPVTQFGGFIVEKEGPNKDKFNLQTQALHYLVNTTRLLSIYAGISDMNTVERIEHLARKQIIPFDMANQAIISFDTIAETLISEQISQSREGLTVTNYINPLSLSLFYQEKLRKALQYLTIYTSYGTNLLKEV